jgi:hypothetical protein
MKSTVPTLHLFQPSRRAVRLLLACAFAAAGGLLRAEEPAPKHHVLFMGAVVSVKEGESIRPVRDVSGDDLLVQGPAGLAKVRQGARTDLRVDFALKLTDQVVEIAGLRADRGAATSDNEAVMQTARLGALAQDRHAEATNKLGNQLSQYSEATSGSPYSGATVPIEGAGVGRSQFYDAMITRELSADERRMNAIDVQFRVSSPRTLEDAYAVIIVQYHPPMQERAPLHWVTTRPLGRVDDRPRAVSVRRDGFPAGFTIDKVSVHVFEGASELATNISESRVTLTREEAHQFMVLDYVDTHPGETVPAKSILVESLPVGREGLSAEQVTPHYRVKVSKDGLPTDFSVEGGGAVSEPNVRTVLAGLRFLPALKAGQPVESTVEIHLDQMDR